MVGALLMIVKNRDGQFILRSIISSDLQGQVQTAFGLRTSNEGSFRLRVPRAQETEGPAQSTFLDCRGRAVLA